jgi:predicted SAM-dependent methyltransferase
MKINIGAGDTRYEDYIRIDYDEKSNPDYVVDIENDKLPFEDSTVDSVIAHHILEHLGEGYFHCLQEIYRVCKHGAVVDIRVPHPRHDTYLADPTHRRPITTMGLQLFSQKFNNLCREQGYASSRLGEYFNVDFVIINFNYIPDDKVKQSLSHLSLEKLQEYADQHNNIILEIHVQLVVVKHGK